LLPIGVALEASIFQVSPSRTMTAFPRSFEKGLQRKKLFSSRVITIWASMRPVSKRR